MEDERPSRETLFALGADELTQLLVRSEEDDAVRDRVYELVYRDLHELARSRLSHGASSSTLSATALVHEVFVKLEQRTGGAWNGRTHFFRLAARAMRQIAVDHARARSAAKRGGDGPRESLAEEEVRGEDRSEMVLALEELLYELREDQPRCVQVVECRFFGGYTEEETAEVLGLSLRTVQRDWQRARDWLKERLSE